jgi:DNA mismatch repair ATPase MutS
VQPGKQNLFIMDEVFKGTNAVERIAAAKAILSYLNRFENIVMVATHDVELAQMLSEEYDQYHFTETIQDGKLVYDHTIHPGVLKSKNAIRFLELSGYPTEIIAEARELTSLFQQSGYKLLPLRGDF